MNSYLLFTSQEELFRIIEKTYDSWVQCDKCSKWRKLPPNIDPVTLPLKWDCDLDESKYTETD